MAGKIVSIDGLIGSGKSTTLNHLEKIGYCVFPEDLTAWGALLNMFYNNPKRWSFTFQNKVLTTLANQLQEICTLQKENELIFIERAPDSSKIFAKIAHLNGYMNEEEFNLYLDIFTKLVWKPDFKFYINTNETVCMERIKLRGRNCEKDVDINYLTLIKDKYEKIKFDKTFDGVKPTAVIADEIIDSLKNC